MARRRSRGKGKSGLIPIKKNVTRVRKGKTENFTQTYWVSPAKIDKVTKEWNKLFREAEVGFKEIAEYSKALRRKDLSDNERYRIWQKYLNAKRNLGARILAKGREEYSVLRDDIIPKFERMLDEGKVTGINLTQMRSGIERKDVDDFDVLFTGAYLNTSKDFTTGGQFGRPAITVFRDGLKRLMYEDPELYTAIERIDIIPRVSMFKFDIDWLEVPEASKNALKRAVGNDKEFNNLDIEVMFGFKFKEGTPKDYADKLVKFLTKYWARSDYTKQGLKRIRLREVDAKEVKNINGYIVSKSKDGKKYYYVDADKILWSVPDIRVSGKYNLGNETDNLKKAYIHRGSATQNTYVTTLTKTNNKDVRDIIKSVFGNAQTLPIYINKDMYEWIGD